MTEQDLQQQTEIAARLTAVRERIAAAAARAGRRAEAIRLVAVSKTQPVDMIAAAVAAGAREFGENKAQELRDKMPQFAPGISWHFIGRLQTNKIKYVVPGACLIHSLDRLDLATGIDQHAERAGRVVAVLIEVNTSGEESKAGLSPAELPDFLARLSAYEHLRVQGLMTMAAPGDQERARESFRLLRRLRDELHATPSGAGLVELSMGMSGDYEIAVEEGATIVRVGTAIFGARRPTLA